MQISFKAINVDNILNYRAGPEDKRKCKQLVGNDALFYVYIVTINYVIENVDDTIQV